MKLKIFLTILFLSATAFAAEEAEQEGVPVRAIIYQAINVALIVIGLIYALKKTVAAHFLSRRNQFEAQLKATELAKQEAHKNLADLKHKYEDLDKNYNKNLAESKTEAEQLKARLISEVQAQAEKLKKDADTSAKMEIEVQKRRLQARFAGQVIEQTEQDLSKNLNQEADNKIQSKFISGLQAGLK